MGDLVKRLRNRESQWEKFEFLREELLDDEERLILWMPLSDDQKLVRQRARTCRSCCCSKRTGGRWRS